MPKPVTVVSGIPRSGTSLMMNILQAAGLPILSDGKREPDASNPRGYFELDAVKRSRRDTGWLTAAPGGAVKIIHSLLDCLPDDYTYRVILMRRPIAAVVASQNRMLDLQGKHQPGLGDERLKAILLSQLEESRKLLAAKPCFDWIEIDYPSLIDQPQPALEALGDFLGLSLQIEKLIGCIDPTLQH
ncbi:MAG TPA: sulfotransferase family protein [Myxococcales bacterium]|nr:sulfotransferase family protein [Myxococcales bacterium]HIL01693.1 sulfotransferase family protein [Myxococcales bacterium]